METLQYNSVKTMKLQLSPVNSGKEDILPETFRLLCMNDAEREKMIRNESLGNTGISSVHGTAGEFAVTVSEN